MDGLDEEAPTPIEYNGLMVVYISVWDASFSIDELHLPQQQHASTPTLIILYDILE